MFEIVFRKLMMSTLRRIRWPWFLFTLIGLASPLSVVAIPISSPNSTASQDETATSIGLINSITPIDQSVNASFRQKLELGLKALKQGNLVVAQNAFTDATTIDPKSAIPYIGLAEIAGRRNQLKVVEAMLKKAGALEPTNPEVLRTVGRFRLMRGDAVGAEDILNKAVKLDPSSIVGNLLLADTYLKGLRKPVKAEAVYKRVIRLDSGNVDATMGLAAALAAQGKITLALNTYAEASHLAPSNPLPIHASARLLASQAKFEAAIKALNKTIKIDPAFLPAYLDKGDLYLLKGDIDSAVSAYKAATISAPHPAFAYFKLGAALQAQQKWDGAEENYLKAVKLDPRMFGAYNNLAWIATERRVRLDDALVWAKKAIQISPKRGALYDTLGSVHIARGEIDQAIAAFSKAVTLSPSRPEFQYRLGLAYKARGKFSDAETAFKRALGMGVKFTGMNDARNQLSNLESR